jgi:4-hydroxyphenylpyruvate dioxygenase
MGPFPYDAPVARIDNVNVAGTDGFEFVEFASTEPGALETLFAQMGYQEVARHRTRDVSLYRQGSINYLINRERQSHAGRFCAQHGPCAPSMAWRVVDAQHALKRCLDYGAVEYRGADKTLDVPAVVGIGGSLLYLVEKYGEKGSPYAGEFDWLGAVDPQPHGVGFHYIDHLTHNVARNAMSTWYDFYSQVFNFKEIRFFAIEGKMTGLISRALTSPCGKIRIPINESTDDKSQIEEYLRAYKGEGIQHIAVGTEDIYRSVEAIAARGLEFMPPPPDLYSERSRERVHGHRAPVETLRRLGLLIDGEGVEADGRVRVLLQIFSKLVIGPIFFEFIQRKGDDGFGEGNFKALFESIEEDQIRRGVLSEAAA